MNHFQNIPYLHRAVAMLSHSHWTWSLTVAPRDISSMPREKGYRQVGGAYANEIVVNLDGQTL